MPTPEHPDVTEAAAITKIAVQGATPFPLDPEGLYLVADLRTGGTKIIDPEGYASRPRRKTGTSTTTDALSLLGYLNKHAGPDTEVWVDPENRTIVAVIDAHGADRPGHGQHRARLELTHTHAWTRWGASDRKMLTQIAFAEHIEDRLTDVITPPAADLLELAQTFIAKRSLTYESSRRLSTGQVEFDYRETTDAKAGHKGRLEIPERFTLALPVFIGPDDPVEVRARLRYRITDGALTLGYFLDRPEDVVRDAFAAVVHHVAANLPADIPVLAGRPA